MSAPSAFAFALGVAPLLSRNLPGVGLTLPVIAMFLAMQRLLIDGLMTGTTKGET